jgi:hypothetical protein
MSRRGLGVGILLGILAAPCRLATRQLRARCSSLLFLIVAVLALDPLQTFAGSLTVRNSGTSSRLRSDRVQ